MKQSREKNFKVNKIQYKKIIESIRIMYENYENRIKDFITEVKNKIF